MLSTKKMILLFLVFALTLIVIIAVAWHFFFGIPNPTLPTTQVTIASSSTNNSNAATTTTVASSSADVASSTAVVTSTTASSSTDADVNPQLPTEQLDIDNAVFNVEVASTMLQRARGLSNRTSLGPNDGMLFIFSSGSTQSFWMKDMNFPLDMIWISGNTVVGFAQNAPAEPNVAFPNQIFYSPANTDKVLEVNSGTVAKYNIQIGDTVTIK
jgi:uncharacterized membrane protein (UPF0127 family)